MSFRLFREVEEILYRYFQIIPSPSPEKRGYWFNGACSSHAYTREKGYLKGFRADHERNKPELLALKKFLDTHDLAAVNKRFNTTERCFTHLMEIFTSMDTIRIDLFIPPYCTMAWIKWKKPFWSPRETEGGFSSYIGGILYILDKIEEFPNIHLYAFDDVAEITGNTANYSDDIHYGIGINRYILRSLKAGKHQITKDNVLAYLQRMAEVLVAFDPTPDYTHTVSFEGPLNEETEKAFATFPPPMGPEPLLP
jgi:hypothetical protein